jgi:O-antigen/teichoic acid export membrane protein
MTSAPYSGSNTRRNVLMFLVGKVPTGILTASVLGLSARVVSAPEFGAYVLAMALLELMLGLSTLGLDWVLLRYIPEFRVHGSRRGLWRLVLAVAGTRVLVLSLLAGGLGLWTDALRGLGLPLRPDLVPLFALLLVVEGGMRIFRDNALEALALQPQVQFCTLTKGVLLVGALTLMGRRGLVTASQLLTLELTAAVLSLLLAGACVLLALRKVEQRAQQWTPPRPRQLLEVALHNYASGVVEYLYSPSFLIVMLAKIQPSAAIAGLGFVLRLVDIIRNYLPGMLVFGVVRARMIGAYASSRDFTELRAWAQFVYKLSALTLFPVVGVALVYGEPVLDWASGGRYAGYRLLFTVLTGWLALRLHRLILGVVCNAVELARLWARAALMSLLVLPLMFWWAYAALGLWFIPLALFGNEIVINLLVTRGMRQAGMPWRLPLAWLMKSALALAGGCAAAWWLPLRGMLGVGAGIVLMGLVYGGLLLAAGILDRGDKQLINRSAGRRLFALN